MVAELRHLAEIGYARGLRARLDELAEEQPELEDAIVPLRDLVGDFRLPEFLVALARAERKAQTDAG